MIYMKNMKKDLSIKQIYDDFILKVTLDEDEIKVLDMYIKNYSYVQMSLALNISERNILNAKDLQYQLNECCCTLRAEGLANTQKILDKMCENEISQLRTDLQSAQLQISQLSQTANITNTLRPFPTPSYVVSSPYTSLYNPYNGCGCGNSTII